MNPALGLFLQPLTKQLLDTPQLSFPLNPDDIFQNSSIPKLIDNFVTDQIQQTLVNDDDNESLSIKPGITAFKLPQFLGFLKNRKPLERDRAIGEERNTSFFRIQEETEGESRAVSKNVHLAGNLLRVWVSQKTIPTVEPKNSPSKEKTNETSNEKKNKTQGKNTPGGEVLTVKSKILFKWGALLICLNVINILIMIGSYIDLYIGQSDVNKLRTDLLIFTFISIVLFLVIGMQSIYLGRNLKRNEHVLANIVILGIIADFTSAVIYIIQIFFREFLITTPIMVFSTVIVKFIFFILYKIKGIPTKGNTAIMNKNAAMPILSQFLQLQSDLLEP